MSRPDERSKMRSHVAHSFSHDTQPRYSREIGKSLEYLKLLDVIKVLRFVSGDIDGVGIELDPSERVELVLVQKS